MSDFDNVVPDWGDVPEDDTAEPDDLMVAHEATPEEVEAAVAEGEESEDSDESQDPDDEFVPVDRGGNPLVESTEESTEDEGDEA